MTQSALTPLFALALCLASIAASGVAAGAQPSYECGKAVTTTEKAICANDALAGLDRALRDEDGDKQTYEIRVAMKRAGLVLEEGEPRLAGAFCGHNGSIEGSYRRVRKLNVSGEG